MWIEVDPGRPPRRLALSVVRVAPMPAWLRAVADAVLGDMQLPHPIDVHLAYEPMIDGSGYLHVFEPGGSVATHWIEPGEKTPSPAELVSFADFLQDQFFAESNGAWAEARPRCPGHPHPASPAEMGGEAWWVCPRDERRIAPIGQLADPLDELPQDIAT